VPRAHHIFLIANQLDRKDKLANQDDTAATNTVSEALDIPGRRSTTPPPLPPSPTIPQDPQLSTSLDIGSPGSPNWATPPKRRGQRNESSQGSPLSDPIIPNGPLSPGLQNGFNVQRQDADVFEPQRPLPYTVAKM
jgi:hypothetical protein